MFKEAYRDAMDHLEPEKGLEERLLLRLRNRSEHRATQHYGSARRWLRKPLAVAAAIVLVLAMGTGTALGAIAIVNSLKTEEKERLQAELSASLATEVQKLLEGNEVKWATDTFLDETVSIDGLTLHLTEMLKYDQEEPNYYLFLDGTFDSTRDDLSLEKDVWKLTANGKTTESRDNMLYDWEDGKTHISFEFPYDGAFVPGEQFTLSCDVRAYNDNGEPTGTVGTIEKTFTFTQEQADAKRKDTATMLVEYDRNQNEEYLKNLDAIPDEATAVNLKKNGALLADVSEANGCLYFGFKYDIPEESGYIRVLVDGYEGAPQMITYTSPEVNPEAVFYSCYIPRDPEKLPESSTIAVIIGAGMDSAGDTILFRYDWKTKVATPPKDEAEAAEWYQTFLTEREEKKLPDGYQAVLAAGRTTQSHVTVEHVTVEFSSNNYLFVSGNVYGLRALDVMFAYIPRVYVDGKEAPSLMGSPIEVEGMLTSEALDWPEVSESESGVSWYFHPPVNYLELPDSFTVEVVWEPKDASPSHKMVDVGTFRFSATLQKSAFTAMSYEDPFANG